MIMIRSWYLTCSIFDFNLRWSALSLCSVKHCPATVLQTLLIVSQWPFLMEEIPKDPRGLSMFK